MIICIITPLMRRAHSLKVSQEICFIDSTGSCDQGNSSVTFVFSATKVGALPLACVIHSSQTEEEYVKVFNLILNTVGSDAFFGNGFPKVILTDDSSAERNALRIVFPKSSMFLCIFHFCQSIWRWLWNLKQSIHKEHRPFLMNLVRNVLFANTTQECDEYYDNLKHDDVARKYPNFIKYMEEYWKRKQEWCLSFRAGFFTRGNNTNNYAESSIRIFKDVILERCKVYNGMALITFVTTVLEEYHIKRLLKFANGRVTKPSISYMNFMKKSKDLTVIDVSHNIYHVTSSSDEQLLYSVNIESESCDCPEGFSGKFCKHIFAVHLKTNLQFMYLPILAASDKADLAKLALGDKIPEHFFLDMDHDRDSDPTSEGPNITRHTSTNSATNIVTALFVEPQKFSEDIFETQHNLLRTNMEKLLLLTEKYKSNQMLELLTGFNKKIDNINTEQQLKTFIANTTINCKKGKYIKVQPTALSRRAHGSRSQKRRQSGRPSGQSRPKKKKRCLSKNIAENTPNAKGH